MGEGGEGWEERGGTKGKSVTEEWKVIIIKMNNTCT